MQTTKRPCNANAFGRIGALSSNGVLVVEWRAVLPARSARASVAVRRGSGLERQLGARFALAEIALVVALIVCGVAAGSGALYATSASPGRRVPVAHQPAAVQAHRGASAAEGRAKVPKKQPSRHASLRGWLWSLLGVVAAAALLVAAWRRRRSGRVVEPDPSRPPADGMIVNDVATRVMLRAGVSSAATRLELAADPRQAVLRCWLELEQAAADLRVPRAPTETSAELTRRLLGLVALDEGLLDELHAAYRVARFSVDVVEAEMVDATRLALSALERQLAGPGRAVQGTARAETPR